MRLFLYIILITTTLLSCSKNKCGNYAYLGGEIINTNTSFVVLSKSSKILDTFKLDGNNRFLHKIQNLDTGFYTFKHGGEIQMVLLEPGDSLMFRLNTLDFDGSLVFTGKGSKKNNYFINEFLQNESEEKRIFKFCQLTPTSYQKHLDSIRLEKNKRLTHFLKKHNPSELFNKIAQANIDYAYYSSKEIYPFIHYGKNKKKILKNIPVNFYDYRNTIDYNNSFTKDHFNYSSLLKSTFNNLALEEHLEHDKSDYFKWTDLCYNLDRLFVIDSMIDNTSIKNDMLFHYSINYLTKNRSLETNDKLVKSYISKSSNEKDKNEILAIHDAINKLKPGEKLPNIALVNLHDEAFNMSNLLSKPTVFYFWSHLYDVHFKESHKRIKKLQVKYPEINFISINADDYSYERWRTTLKKSKLPLKNEYRFQSPLIAKEKLAIYPITKALLVDKNNAIVSCNANIFTHNFETELLGLLNQ